jgi:penicillin-binding protein 1A
MATRRKEIARDLLDALRGDGGAEQDDERPRRGRFARDRERPKSDRFVRDEESPRNGGARQAERPWFDRFAPVEEPFGTADELFAPEEELFPPDGPSAPDREAIDDPPESGDGAREAERPKSGRFVPDEESPRNGAAVFKEIRGRARELVHGFRDSGLRAGENLRALRERDGTGAPATLPGPRRGGISPPWRRTPGLPQPPGPRPPGGGRRLKKLRLAIVIMGLGLLAFVSWIFGIMMSVAQDLPALENRQQYKNAQNSKVVDRNGEPLATLTSNQRRLIVPSEDISQTVKQAVVAVEDQRFYEHRGIDFQGIGRAVTQDILAQDTTQGASTITQQFVKNALRAQDSRTVFQKLREAALAYHLERHWSKDKILTEYLNSIYFGEGAYGIESAAQTYFGWNHPGCGSEDNRCASQLLPEEAALLAGMISSPSAYSPRTLPDAATERRNLVLDRMVDQGVLTTEQAQQSAAAELPDPGKIDPPDENSLSPYFTTWLRQQVVDRYGSGEAFGGGLKVTSTIDLELQEQVEEIAYSKLAGIEPTSSIVVIDNRTGGVLAMVGGNNYEKEPFNLATNGHRQPGSAFKPFILARALEEGHSPEEVFPSQPKEFRFHPPGGKPELFEVENYEDQYLGSASIATATQYSDNSVFAELGLQVGTEDVASTAEKMGIQTNLSTNPAMLLGGLETGVSPLEMAYAFSTLGRSGQRIGGTMDSVPGSQLGPTGIMKVTDAETDELVEDKTGSSGENDVQTEQVIDPTAADTAVGLLESVVSGGTGESASTGDYAWGKTGTTDDNGDAWFVGGTEDITAAVWVGHPNEVVPMKTEYNGGPVDGGTFPALIWHDVVLAYESIIGSAKEEDKSQVSTSSGAPTSTTPAAPVAPVEPTAPVAPVPTEPVVPEETAPAPTAPAPDGGATDTGGGTGATGISP